MIHGARSLVCGLPLCLSSAVLPVVLARLLPTRDETQKATTELAYIFYHVS